jgi:hypothetical protein
MDLRLHASCPLFIPRGPIPIYSFGPLFRERVILWLGHFAKFAELLQGPMEVLVVQCSLSYQLCGWCHITCHSTCGQLGTFARYFTIQRSGWSGSLLLLITSQHSTVETLLMIATRPIMASDDWGGGIHRWVPVASYVACRIAESRVILLIGLVTSRVTRPSFESRGHKSGRTSLAWSLL